MVKYLLILLIAICIYCYFFNNKNPEGFSASRKVSKKNIIKSTSEETPNKSKTLKPKKLKTKTLKSNYLSIKDKLGKATSLVEIKTLLEKAKIKMKVFDYTTMTDVNLAKSSAITLIDLLNILESESGNKLDYNDTLNFLLGLDFGNSTFKTILSNVKFQDAKQLDILTNFITILKTLPQISISKEPSLDDIPKNIFVNANKIFPLRKDANICTASDNLLDNLRKNRIIGFDQYVAYSSKIKNNCKIKSEKKVISKSKINPKKIKNLDQVPIDKKVGLPLIKAEFKSYKDFIDNKTTGAAKDVIQSINPTFNLMSSLYGV
jgi:hypothetical protein